MPRLVPAGADLPGTETMSARVPNSEQQTAIEASGLVFVSAGAGTGKTMVLVERFCRAVIERGFPVESLLVITYTDRAAGELRSRIRSALHEKGRSDLARELDGAWISTIHGFCSRLLRQNAVAAGIDPHFRVLDAEQALVLARDAFAAALEEFCVSGDPVRTALLVSYGRAGLRRMIVGIHETLRSAGRPLELELSAPPPRADAEAALAAEARALAADAKASEQARATARELLDLLGEHPSGEQLLELGDFCIRGKRAICYEQARRELEQAARDELALRDRDLVQELLGIFDRAYKAAKDAASALDFEDLQLYTRDLLKADEQVLAHERLRFRSLMVDEFQDTNRLQCEIIDLLAGEVGAASAAAAAGVEELFFVGDEFQSIYRFRHADVDVFRERREQSGEVLALTFNYRSRPELLGAVNHLFAGDFGEENRPLVAAAEFPEPGAPAVELLVTDKASYSGADRDWRRAEARHIAARVRRLVDDGEAIPGEIVLLFAAGTDAELYEQELRALDLPTYRATGRGYYGQQQVVDLLAYLRLLHNRYDDEALCTVLASPFVGVSNDALFLLRRAAPRRPLYCGIERGLPPGLDESDERLFRAFRQRYERLATASELLSLEQLCEQIICEHDYDLALLAQWDGRQRYANVRKLARMARSFEELRGPDIEGFVRFVSDLGAAGASAREAPAEEEGSDSIRLLTIHSAKGLEFKVVVVADAGRASPHPSSDEILCLSDGRLGFRVADPGGGKRYPALGYERVREADAAQEEAERRRLYYVAMTRAIDRLLVSGALDPASAADAQTPIGWILGRLGGNVLEQAEAEVQEIACGESRVLVRIDRYRPEDVESEVEAGFEGSSGDQLSLFRPGSEPASESVAVLEPLAPLAPIAVPPLHRPRRLSYSALSLFESCSYRYFAERVCGMRSLTHRPEAPAGAGLAAVDIGSAVHELLEVVDLTAPEVPPRAQLEQSVHSNYPQATEEDLERIERLVSNYCDSELAGRVAKLPRPEAELLFVFEQDGVLVNGFLDVASFGGGKAFVLDYKTNLLDRAAAEIAASDYRLQRLVYALACLRAGYEEVEVVYAFLEDPDAVVSTIYRARDAAELERELSEAIQRVEKGEFAPTPSRRTCSDCPVSGVVCAGMDLPGAPPRLAPASAEG
ncbi:MAG: UvrD-helicase domain-containing protein [Gaiellaceae bacterium]